MLILLACAPFALARTRSVTSGSSDAALAPITVPGAAVSGVVSSISGNIISLAGGLVTVDASNAKIADERGGAGSIASITPGSTILAVLGANVTTNTPLPAISISVQRIAQVELTGTVSAVGATSLTVLGRTINVDANTSFGDRARNLGDVFVNDVVTVTANVSGGALLAASLRVTSPPPRPPTVIHGAVKSIATQSWVITDKAGKDWPVLVNSQTKIVGDPKIGDAVEILANIDNAGQYVAVSIAKTPVIVGTPTLDFSGSVKEIGAKSWTIRTEKAVVVAVNEKTKITGDPKVNDGVHVTASIDAAGNLTALEIAKLGIVPPPVTITLRGKVKSIVDSSWTVGPSAGLGPDTQFTVNATTKIVGDPKVGDNVVAVLKSDASRYVAISVEKQQ